MQSWISEKYRSVVEISEQSLESALNELEEIVRELESGRLSLDESLELFERGVRLVRICSSKIEGAERRIESLTGAIPEDLLE
ncbi:exodeoxyribonuclease VII small subunit [Methanothrix thermoacetophila]|jgi:Exodeoxyribonuclease VII small subunit (EC 3.1.11.6)|uniref:Exodeoxyribonuclease VII, small subunit n=1 Tax=Methanothrix thermoacetophila (strain DSM 6194 / JCM 14653 / NBRC 101360 / PT) TaxID=349307 RepID=A0B8C7_METTP|nr:exodeoxyribonuclease VII, small subunit [Methanothrix thermoacetophila PT]